MFIYVEFTYFFLSYFRMFQPRSLASSSFLPFTAWEGGCDCLQINVTFKYDATIDSVTKIGL